MVAGDDEVWRENGFIRSRIRSRWLSPVEPASGRFVQGSRIIAASASSSRLQQQLNDAWRELDDDLDDTIDLSNDFVTDSARTMPFSSDSPSIGQHGSRTTPTHTSNSNANQSGSAGRKRSRPARPCDILGVSLMTVAYSMLKFGLGESVNRTSKVLEILEEVQGLTNSEFFEVGQLLSKDNDLASFFMSLRPERRVDWLKKTLQDHFGDRGMAKDKYYVVLVGRRPGIYISWDDARVEVEGYSGARHRAFRNWKEVMACWDEHFSKACAPSTPCTASHAVQVAGFSDDLYIRHSSSHSSHQTMPTAQGSIAMVSRAVSTVDLPPSPRSDGEIFCALLVVVVVMFLAFLVIFKF